MRNVDEYLQRTESAVRHLFNAITGYIDTLKAGIGPIFVSGLPYGPEQDAHYSEWCLANSEELAKSKAAMEDFRAEAFALDTICGSILQIAEKGLEIYSENTQLHEPWGAIIPPYLAKFCVGREVRSTPLGLIVYAARNQHVHFNDSKLKNVSASIFNNLATAHGYGSNNKDPAFDLENPNLESYASNVTSLIG
ncbi:hypothetical protein [Pseudomonas sp. Pdm06]|uniref:hypothetical protein n=1 Tax=Pseudomonas sp. Pdm06 TaxID=1790044 RepID=UPI00177CE8CC|nr:hypothetical protein [Pseudomonas sp. Pdm06]MBD9463922.1 hypothetical protein [Pseudomonas sp. Pdm06]